MASFREKLLQRVDKIRQIPQKAFDLRQNTIDMVVRAWSGGSAGVGTLAERRTRLYVGGSCNIRVREITSKDIVASGGLLTLTSVKVGPFTPDYPGGGLPREAYDPPAQGAEVLFLIKGHGMGADGTWFKRVNDHSTANFTTWLYLDSDGVMP
jgi:hypothetical protein